MPGMRPADIGLLTNPGDVTIAPDGGRAVYTLTTVDAAANTYRSRLWLVRTDGGAAPRPLSAGHDRDASPRWSPDGTMLAWVSSGDEGTAIRVIAVDGPGESAVVCRWPDRITELAWAPTGDRLAFAGRVRDLDRYGTPDRPKKDADMPPRRITRLMSRHDGEDWVVDRPTHVHVVPVDGSAPATALTSGESAAGSIAWAPDGRRLCYVSATHDTWDLDGRDDVWVIDAGGGTPTKLTDTTMSWGQPAWSPDGSSIALFVHPTPLEEPRHGQLRVIDVASRQVTRWAADLDRNLRPYPYARPPMWLSADEVVISYEEHGGSRVAVVSAPEGGSTGKIRDVVGGRQVVRSWDAAAGTIAFVATGPAEQPELWATSLDGGEARKLTDHGATLRERVTLVAPERFTATSADGTEVECWAMAPVGAEPGRRYPTILNIHGGPFTQYGWGFFDEFQLQTGAGLGVVFCNPRGSSGYTEAWGRAIRWPEAPVDPGSGWGGVDYEDVMACAEEATKRFDWVDGERLGVQGGSYGGYMT
ncbi:MAG TPA: S9 family peptidase, partial [Acidimicrobiales bacterium]|nr:S9 family peptidase [Acidimicrobiales bacterium]